MYTKEEGCAIWSLRWSQTQTDGYVCELNTINIYYENNNKNAILRCIDK